MTHCPCPASGASIVLHITSPQKDPSLKFEVQFLMSVYYFGTKVRSKNYKVEPSLSQGPSVISNNINVIYRSP